MLRGDQCILLSFFSGMEVAATAFTEMVGQSVLHLTWETDPVCCQIIADKFPDAKQRGDVLKETASSVVEVIDRYDSHQTCVVIFLAAPPCPDFSSINDSAEGLAGEEDPNSPVMLNWLVTSRHHLGPGRPAISLKM